MGVRGIMRVLPSSRLVEVGRAIACTCSQEVDRWEEAGLYVCGCGVPETSLA